MVPSPVDFLTAIQQMPPGYAKNQMMEAAYKNVLTMPEKHDARLMHEETIRAQQALTAAMANARIQSSERNADVNAERARQTATITAAARGTMGTPSISKEDAERIAEQALTGDKSALTGLGYGGTGAANRAFVQSTMTRLAKERNMSGADVAAANANFASVMAGERAVGTRGAQVEMAVIEASKMATLVTQASENFSRTEFVPINKAISAFESNTGSVEVVQLGWAINSFINAYARAVSPVGVPPEKEREYARKLLSTATTHDQVVGSLAQLQKEMETAQAAPREVREQFRKEVGTVPPKRVTNDDEYNALEPGAVFIDPNGKQRQKPK